MRLEGADVVDLHVRRIVHQVQFTALETRTGLERSAIALSPEYTE